MQYNDHQLLGYSHFAITYGLVQYLGSSPSGGSLRMCVCMYNEFLRAGASLEYAYFILGAPIRSNNDIDTEYAVQQFTSAEFDMVSAIT